jgi:hypothetical protein
MPFEKNKDIVSEMAYIIKNMSIYSFLLTWLLAGVLLTGEGQRLLNMCRGYIGREKDFPSVLISWLLSRHFLCTKNTVANRLKTRAKNQP